MSKKPMLLLPLLLFLGISVFAQSTNHSKLSLKYDYKISVTKETDEDDYERMKTIVVKVNSKSTKSTVQTIVINPIDNPTYFGEFTETRSYITGYNKKKQVTDNDYGDFIVADVNFDGKEDFAIKVDMGGNGGPIYKFYTMRKEGVFKEDNFLSEEVKYFTDAFDYKNKILTTTVHANAFGYNESIYKYNVIAQKWSLLKRRYVKM